MNDSLIEIYVFFMDYFHSLVVILKFLQDYEIALLPNHYFALPNWLGDYWQNELGGVINLGNGLRVWMGQYDNWVSYLSGRL
jgi:hypothetical protein